MPLRARAGVAAAAKGVSGAEGRRGTRAAGHIYVLEQPPGVQP
jgi:nicotinamide mononucleotide (NMN) deamidase PncC